MTEEVQKTQPLGMQETDAVIDRINSLRKMFSEAGLVTKRMDAGLTLGQYIIERADKLIASLEYAVHTLPQLSEPEVRLLLVAAMLAMTDDANMDALHIVTGQDLQAVDALREKLVEQFPDERQQAYTAACRVIDRDDDDQIMYFDANAVALHVGDTVKLVEPTQFMDINCTWHSFSVAERFTVEEIDYENNGYVTLRWQDLLFASVAGSCIEVVDTRTMVEHGDE